MLKPESRYFVSFERQHPPSKSRRIARRRNPLLELDHDVRNLDILLRGILGGALHDDGLLMVWYRFLRDGGDEIRKSNVVSVVHVSLGQNNSLQRQAILQLGHGVKARVEQAHTGAGHGNGKTLLLEIVQKLLERDVLHLEPVPDLVDEHLFATV